MLSTLPPVDFDEKGKIVLASRQKKIANQKQANNKKKGKSRQSVCGIPSKRQTLFIILYTFHILSK